MNAGYVVETIMSNLAYTIMASISADVILTIHQHISIEPHRWVQEFERNEVLKLS